MEKKYGLTPIRRCKPEEEDLIKRKYAQLKSKLLENRLSKVYWLNIYLNKQFCWKPNQEEAQLFEWCQKLVSELQNGVPHSITNIGFTVNPTGNQEIQQYHFDYDESFAGVFIPLSYLTYENSTQFLAFKPKSNPTLSKKGDFTRFGASDKQLLERQGADTLVINQVISKPFMILKLQSGTIHRGVRNLSNEDRTIFYIGYTPQEFTLKESAVDA